MARYQCHVNPSQRTLYSDGVNENAIKTSRGAYRNRYMQTEHRDKSREEEVYIITVPAGIPQNYTLSQCSPAMPTTHHKKLLLTTAFGWPAPLPCRTPRPHWHSRQARHAVAPASGRTG